MNVTLQHDIKATPQRVFEAWTNAEDLAQFMFPAEGTTVTKAEVEAKCGGKFALTMTIGETDIPIRGEYLEFDPYKKLAFTWLSPHSGPQSEVHITLEGIESGTRISLIHKGLENHTQKDSHTMGWQRILNTLAETWVGAA